MAQIVLGAPISTRGGFTVQIVGFVVGTQSGYIVEVKGNASGQPSVRGGKPDQNGLITVENLPAGDTAWVEVTLSGETVKSAVGTPETREAEEIEFDAPISTADGFSMSIKHYDRQKFDYTYEVDSDVGTAEIRNGLIVVKGVDPGQIAEVTVTSKRAGYFDGTGIEMGYALPLVPTFAAPVPKNSTSWTVQISNHNQVYTWTIAISGLTPGTTATISNTGLITVTGLAGPATESTVTVQTSKWNNVPLAPGEMPGYATVTGKSMGITMRWIHVGLEAPDPTDPSSNNNLKRDKYSLSKFSGASGHTQIPLYELSYISHLKPDEMKVLNAGSKDAMLQQGDILNINEHTEKQEVQGKDAKPIIFRYYWSQQPNRKIIDSMSSTTIKMNLKAPTSCYASPSDLLGMLFTPESREDELLINFWGNKKYTGRTDPREFRTPFNEQDPMPQGLIQYEDSPAFFDPNQLLGFGNNRITFSPNPFVQKSSEEANDPILIWHLEDVLKSGWFTGTIFGVQQGMRKKLSESRKYNPSTNLAYTKYDDNRPIVFTNKPNAPSNIITKFSYPINITVTVVLEYIIVGQVKSYEDSIQSKELPKEPELKKYKFKHRVPISMVLPYKMVRNFNDNDAPQSYDTFKTTNNSTYSLEPIDDEKKSMQAFQAFLLNKIPQTIQSTIDLFLLEGTTYYKSHPQKDSNGNWKINFKERLHHQKQTDDLDRPKPATVSGKTTIFRPNTTFKKVSPECYIYDTYNIDLDSLQAATSDIFISRIEIPDANNPPNPVIIAFYNDLDLAFRPDGVLGNAQYGEKRTDLELKTGIRRASTGYKLILDQKDLIPQFKGDVGVGEGQSIGTLLADTLLSLPIYYDPVRDVDSSYSDRFSLMGGTADTSQNTKQLFAGWVPQTIK